MHGEETAGTKALGLVLQKLTNQKQRREHLVKELEDLDTEIARTQQHYFEMRNRETPILRIPVELTSAIFRAAIGNGDTRQGMTARTLSHVCHTWRAIALSLSEFWTSFTYAHKCSDYHRLQSYIERSSNRLLDLKFVIDDGHSSQSLKNMLRSATDMLKLATGQAYRWRRFIFYFLGCMEDDVGPYWRDFILEFSNKRLSAPHLEVLEVGYDAYNDPSPRPREPWFSDVPPKLAHAAFDFWTSSAFKPLCNVTNLQIRNWPDSPAEHDLYLFLQILKSSRIENLTVLTDPFFRPSHARLQPVLVPELRNLRFCNSPNLTYYLFEYIKAPKLELLHIAHTNLPEASDIPFQFASPFPSLRFLILSGTRIDLDSASHLARMTKNVTDLYVVNSCKPYLSGKDLLSIIGEASPGTVFWPHLRSLYGGERISFIRESDFTASEEFLDTLIYRRESLKTQCVLKLRKQDAKIWEEQEPASWQQFVDGGFYEEWAVHSNKNHLPWPPRDNEGIRTTTSWEIPFVE